MKTEGLFPNSPVAKYLSSGEKAIVVTSSWCKLKCFCVCEVGSYKTATPAEKYARLLFYIKLRLFLNYEPQ
jgi:hypothetical protein